jgi:hypothetical protein
VWLGKYEIPDVLLWHPITDISMAERVKSSMRSYRKTILIAVLVGSIAAAATYETTPKTPESCRTFREQMKQLVLSDGGLAGVVVNVPERLLDEVGRERYASMTAGECTAGTPELTAELEAYSHTKWAPLMPKAGEESQVAAAQCRDKRVNGELKTHADSAQCSNPRITAAFAQIGYPYMDLVKELTDKRLAEAEKLDKSLLGGTEDQTEFAKMAFDLTEQERKRITAEQKH